MNRDFLYVGTFPRAYHTDTTDSAFGLYSFSRGWGATSLVAVEMLPAPRPGWIAVHPSRRFLYAVNEVGNFEGRPGGGVSAFRGDRATGALRALNSHPTPPFSCHCGVDASGRFLMVATFGGG